MDLALELTRAANLVCDRSRADLLASYRLEEGLLSIMSGPHEDLTWREVVIKYDVEEGAAAPSYPGLDAFLVGRIRHDMHFGCGGAPE
jgi:hypothetical protein